MDTVSPTELSAALACEVFDKDGQRHTLQSLIKGKRVVVIFVRWFGCGSCHAYLAHFDSYLPSSKLAPGTSVIIIGLGEVPGIKAFVDITKTPWPVYTDPTRSAHKTLKFIRTATPATVDEGREYRKGLGTKWQMFKRSVREWFWAYPHLWNQGGDGWANGGELIFDSNGELLYFYRMKNTTDHTDARDIAKVLGISPADGKAAQAVACGTEACERP